MADVPSHVPETGKVEPDGLATCRTSANPVRRFGSASLSRIVDSSELETPPL
eukprot:CAMPEP_0171964932 /NCGR_PEP_ID=MMETSP0993-20121228/184279_1 /TAXON_ID=483369 /ORGANISM="non described non described, Strain CCMP2098" /LENGTH=51 /DNA_ID=CAMNT_0012613883 /DNA_START=23 /DNA_END=175 /DNA_ORIENTATION=+